VAQAQPSASSRRLTRCRGCRRRIGAVAAGRRRLLRGLHLVCAGKSILICAAVNRLAGKLFRRSVSD